MNLTIFTPIILSMMLALTGCSTDPMSMIPTNQRIFLMAQAQDNHKGGKESSSVEVNDMLSKVRKSYKGKKAAVPNDYYLTMNFQKTQKDLNLDQTKKLEDILQKLSPDKPHVAHIYFGPADGKDPFMTSFTGEQRGTKIAQLLQEKFSKVDLHYDPKLPINVVNLELLTPLAKKPEPRKA